jgi:O-methyltransferase involved in polyketide biosynthesis
MAGEPKIAVDLDGVPETLLWTFYFRALEAARPHGLLSDPLAVELVRRIDYPFAERLGQGAGRAQWQALRAATFDAAIREFLATHPGGTVVALGEGLETQFWRVDDGQVRWLGVDLPATADLRRRLLPDSGRRRSFDGSVLEEAWMREVDPARGVLITAQGLLMYLQPVQVHDLLKRCAAWFPGAGLVFDGVPRWTSALTSRQAVGVNAAARGRGPRAGEPAGGMLAPPMPWSMDEAEGRRLAALPGVAGVRRLRAPRGRGVVNGFVLPAVSAVPGLRSQVLSSWQVGFVAQS